MLWFPGPRSPAGPERASLRRRLHNASCLPGTSQVCSLALLRTTPDPDTADMVGSINTAG